MNSEQLKTLSEANYLQITGQYDGAVALYSQLQSQLSQESYELLVSKAIALISLNNYESALKECENAIVLDRKKYEGLYRRGICNFYLSKYKAALIDFQDVQEKIVKNPVMEKQIQAWIGRCKAEEQNINLQGLIEQGGIKPPQQIQESKMEIEKIQTQTQQQNPAPVQASSIKYTWYQTDNKIGIEINYPLQDSKTLTHQITENSLSVSFPLTSSSNYELNLDLFSEVLPETIKFNVTIHKIEVTVEKKEKSNWKQLTAVDKVQNPDLKKEERKPVQPPVANQPFYPSSSKQKKNWDKIDLEIEEDMKKNKDEYGGDDPLNGIFKQIYQNSDENTRKAMIKSFQTSGGTVLSTNWDEVQSKDYEGKDRPSPPKGQTYAKWDK